MKKSLLVALFCGFLLSAAVGCDTKPTGGSSSGGASTVKPATPSTAK